jgi:hypothetical protein
LRAGMVGRRREREAWRSSPGERACWVVLRVISRASGPEAVFVLGSAAVPDRAMSCSPGGQPPRRHRHRHPSACEALSAIAPLTPAHSYPLRVQAVLLPRLHHDHADWIVKPWRVAGRPTGSACLYLPWLLSLNCCLWLTRLLSTGSSAENVIHDLRQCSTYVKASLRPQSISRRRACP